MGTNAGGCTNPVSNIKRVTKVSKVVNLRASVCANIDVEVANEY